MSRCTKLEERARRSVHNLAFNDVCKLTECDGFVFVGQHGTSHRKYKHARYPAQRMNFHNSHGQAKAYQVRQFLCFIDMIYKQT